MEIKNKKTGYIFEISDKEGVKLVCENPDEFEPFKPEDKKLLPPKTKPKTIREKVMEQSCLNSLSKKQIIQELQELSVSFNPKTKKAELIELLKKTGGF